VRHRLGQRAENQARQEMPDQMPRTDRSGEGRVEDAPLWRRHVDRAEAAFVVRDLRGDGRLDGETGVGVGVIEDHVDAIPALRRTPGVVHQQLVTVDRYLRLDEDRLLEAVTPELVVVLAVRHGGY